MNQPLSPRRHIIRLFVAAYLIVMLAVNAANAGLRVGPIEVNVVEFTRFASTSHTNKFTLHGYNEYVVDLQNHSKEDVDVVVELKFRPYWGAELPVSVRRATVPKEQRIAVSIFQPPIYSDNPVVEVNVSGVRTPGSIAVSSPLSVTRGRFAASRASAILVSRSSPEFLVKSLDTVATVLINDLPINRWSTHWLGYSSFDAIILTDNEVNDASPEVQSALRRYAECGGTILIRGKAIPEVWSEGAEKENNNNYLVGLGKISIINGPEVMSWIFPTETSLRSGFHSYIPDDIPNTPDGLLIEKGSVPVRGMFVLIVLFGIGIGPVNLFLLARTNRRIWFWWNVPLIATLTCGLIFGYALFSDGISNRSLAASMTLLDQPRHRATTFGYCSYYCPLTPSSGPMCTVDTDIKHLQTPQDDYYTQSRRSTPRITDWTEGQQLATGWISARVPTYFQFRQTQDRRERLTVEVSKDGTYSVVNALGAKIKRLYLAKDNGEVIAATDIDAGARTSLDSKVVLPLKPSDNRPKAPFKRSEVQSIFRQTYWLPVFRSWNSDPFDPQFLAPGCYVAFLDASPFVEQTLSGTPPQNSVAIVYGIYKD